jgi:hypothetical protein
LAYLLSNVSVRTIFFLLIGGGLALASIAFVHFGIVGCWSRLLGHWRLRSYGSNGEQQTGA